MFDKWHVKFKKMQFAFSFGQDDVSSVFRISFLAKFRKVLKTGGIWENPENRDLRSGPVWGVRSGDHFHCIFKEKIRPKAP